MKKVIAVLFFVLVAATFVVSAQTKEVPRERIVGRTFMLAGDGITDDTEPLNAWGRGERVIYRGKVLKNVLQNGRFLVTWKVKFNRPNSLIRYNTFIVKYSNTFRIIDYGNKVRQYQNTVIREGWRDRIIRKDKRYSPMA